MISDDRKAYINSILCAFTDGEINWYLRQDLLDKEVLFYWKNQLCKGKVIELFSHNCLVSVKGTVIGVPFNKLIKQKL